MLDWRWLAPLLALDLVLIGIFLALQPDVPQLWEIDDDHSLGEIAGYAKWIAAALLLRGGGPVARAFGILFWAMLADDALKLHENTGDLLGPMIGQDAGELAFYALLAALTLPRILRAVAGASGAERRDGLVLFGLVALFALFAVGIDLVHALLDAGEWMSALEDGGEMIAASLIVGACAAIRRRRRPR